jgi:hypothetical protein
MMRSGIHWLRSAVRANTVCLILGVGLLPATAQPLRDERVPLAYLVDRSLFKAVERGDALEFEIHLDPSCSEPVDSETVVVGSASDLWAEVVSIREIQDIGRRVRPIRLHYQMEPEGAFGRLYLRVTGPHIAPVGSDCQAQAVSIQEHVPDTLDTLQCADGSSVKWEQANAEWDCASEQVAGGALSCLSVSASLEGAASPYAATATCPEGSVRTGGGHGDVSAGSTVLSSQADGANGWFCSVAGAAPSGSCQALCCALE